MNIYAKIGIGVAVVALLVLVGTRAIAKTTEVNEQSQKPFTPPADFISTGETANIDGIQRQVYTHPQTKERGTFDQNGTFFTLTQKQRR